MLMNGEKYLDTDILSFSKLAYKFFQIDINICEGIDCDLIINQMMLICSGKENIERIIKYSNNFIRFTFEKDLVSLYTIWNHLDQWIEELLINSYKFKNMDMEEVLSTIINSSK